MDKNFCDESAWPACVSDFETECATLYRVLHSKGVLCELDSIDPRVSGWSRRIPREVSNALKSYNVDRLGMSGFVETRVLAHVIYAHQGKYN